MILGAALGAAPAARADVNLSRDDLPLPSAPDSVALGDLDGVHGKDIVVALWEPGAVGVMLNNGDGTFGALKTYSAGPQCVRLAVDITLGDLTGPAGFLVPDGKLDAYVACTPYVVRLTGDGTGALGSPLAFNLNLPQYLGSSTIDFLTLMRRPDGNPAPLLVIQHGVGSFGRELCISYELDGEALVCNHTPVQGPLAVGDLNGSVPGVPPDEIVTSEGGGKLGIFGFAPTFPLFWSESSRPVPGDLESVALGQLDDDGLLDVVTGRPVNSLAARVDSIHYFTWDSVGLDQVATPLPSTPGVDAVAVADVDSDGCNDVIAAGTYGTGMIHLGDRAGTFDSGHDLPQLGYRNPATATRVTMAVDDLTGDGRPEVVMSDAVQQAVMVFRNRSTPAGGACFVPPPPPTVPVDSDPPAVVPATPIPTPTPTPPATRTCINPGTTAYTVGTPGDDVLVGSGGRDVLSGRGGNDCLFGRANDDRISGGTGADLLDGSSGSDRLNGDAGDDKIRGGRGNDDITPGAGKDTVAAQGGDDVISARDGTKDTIDCGAGRDKVTADRTDVVKNCEFVKRAVRKG
jgi:hypothetical protein